MRKSTLLAAVPAVTLVLSAGVLGACTSTPQLRHEARERVVMRDWANALKKYDEVVARSPDDWEGHRGRGLCLLMLNQPLPAETALTRALALSGPYSPAAPGILDDIAKAMLAQKNDQRLAGFLAEQTKRYGGNRDFLRQGKGLAAIGDVDGAVLAFRKAELRAWDEGSANRFITYLTIADFYAGMGDQANSLRYVRYAAFVNPHHPEVEPHLIKLGRVPGPTERMAPPTKEELIKGAQPESVETK
jgi:tetratricopeptide (TPR) repeat protein